ncbi:toxin C-terminal domain-containing protein [Sporosarcina sp. NPDC096371]|uniref:toxin C-terminal domain-containing protein n=1 Tax=Sporosarcina sp. NPDC096371 TaxID=3364530 RepID=UPI00381B8C5E
MEKMKRVVTLLSLLVLFSTTILVPLASAEEREVLTSTELNQLEKNPQSELTEYDLKVLEIIKEIESSDEGVLLEDYQGDDIYTTYGVITPGKYVIPGIGTVMVLVTGAVIIGDVMWQATTSVAKNIIDLLFSKAEPIYKTDGEAKKAADKLGYTKVNETCKDGVAIFKKDKKTKVGPGFISRDLDNHSGVGAWKGGSSAKNICSKTTRSGTYDKDLNRVGD